MVTVFVIAMGASVGSAIADEAWLRSLVPAGASNVHLQIRKPTQEGISYRKLAKYPETAVANGAREKLAREGWKQCRSKDEGWKTYPELRNGKETRVDSSIEYFLNDTSVLRLAFFFRLDPTRGENIHDGMFPQNVAIDRIVGEAKSRNEAAQSIAALGYICAD